MNKRNFLKLSGMTLAGIAASGLVKGHAMEKPGIIKPSALKEGDTVSVIAPGTAVSDPDDIQKAMEILTFLGLQPKFSKSLLEGSGYKTRTVKERVDDLHRAFSDKESKAVFCIRGGYGAAQLLDKIDYSLIAENPKVFVGFSDITALHLAIRKKTGMITFHAPVLLSAFSEYTLNIFKKAVFSKEPLGLIANPRINSGARSLYPTRTINPGAAEGKLEGGNLTLVSSLVGTDYEPDPAGCILFLEEVGEPPYRIDRMMNQLRLAGILDKAEGIVFGRCADCAAGTNQSTWDPSLGEALDFYLKPLGKPVFYGLMIGHTSDQATLPVGCAAKLDADAGTIEILESGVV